MVGLNNPTHIALVLLVVLFLFGAKRLPEMGRSIGAGLRGFKDAVNGDGLSKELEPAPAELPAPATHTTQSDRAA